MSEQNNRWFSIDPLSGKIIPYGPINNSILNEHYELWDKKAELAITLPEGEMPKPSVIILEENGMYFQTTKAYNTHSIGDRVPGFRSVGLCEADTFPFEFKIETYLSNFGEWRLYNYSGEYHNPIYRLEKLINTVKHADYVFEQFLETSEDSPDENKIAIWFRSNTNPEDLQDTPLNSFQFYLSENHDFKLIDKELNNKIEDGYTQGIKKFTVPIRAIEAEIIYCTFNPKFALQIHIMGNLKRIRLLKRKMLTDEEIEEITLEGSSELCSICLEEIDASKTKLPCNHEFCNICLHKLCLDSGYNVNTRCPNCREEFDRSLIIIPSQSTGTTWGR